METTSGLWDVLRDAVWSNSKPVATEEDIVAFHVFGLDRGLGYRDVFPPTRTCLNAACGHYRNDDAIATLTDPITYRATLFTLREGALPVFVTSVYCRGCYRRYHHNYYVEKSSSTRTYYAGPPPDVLQIATHFFAETGVLELFGNGMVFGWLSSSNCARIYNMSLAARHCEKRNNPVAYGYSESLPFQWPYSVELAGPEAMQGFLLYSLLLDKAEHGHCLVLPHDFPTQKDRLEVALAERNKAMEGIGQEYWAHACDLCFIIEEAADGTLRKLQFSVGDGISLGRPCCAVHDSTNALSSTVLRRASCHTRPVPSNHTAQLRQPILRMAGQFNNFGHVFEPTE
ncbi:hypothetical protein EVJ58_g607 [Rhodofomes roseus]|uniref:CxC5 like cysteine cluster associated with KDZ domain-containing protein n=1 Tax=Rhodofomes roseus TaxID=34475 RepID=A0A4Y9Z2M5_9APHY|nr:hypothetical protein EVJ58_g607 [Rhodofomes roseus]